MIAACGSIVSANDSTVIFYQLTFLRLERPIFCNVIPEDSSGALEVTFLIDIFVGASDIRLGHSIKRNFNRPKCREDIPEGYETAPGVLRLSYLTLSILLYVELADGLQEQFDTLTKTRVMSLQSAVLCKEQCVIINGREISHSLYPSDISTI
jgi:hypothetical protein